ncbi:MAG: OmpA family protein [Bacteroidetes bacterium]|nr:OmpA family protein [Bacteroidota bacterium]
MERIKGILVLMLLLAFNAKAQCVKKQVVYFNSNEFKLHSDNKRLIDSFAKALNNIPEAFYVEIVGHTDAVGSKDFNVKLSERRAQSVFSYLKQKGFNSTKNKVDFKYFSLPLVENVTESQWRNRRVEICYYLRQIDMNQSLTISNSKLKSYRFNEDSGGNIKYDSTKIQIAANSFLHKDGKEVTGEIDIYYQEFRKAADFLLSTIPMSVDFGGNILHMNSGGMFKLIAKQNGEELILKGTTDKQIQLKFPLSNTISQDFYQFDTTGHKWLNDVSKITDIHGNMFPPFNNNANLLNNGFGNSDLFFGCVGKDTCAKAIYALNKLTYFVEHEEPIRMNYAYKFIKNEVVDFKSPYYKLEVDEQNKMFVIRPVNKNSKLAQFENYKWTFGEKSTAELLQIRYKNGCSFVKINHKGKDEFELQVEDTILHVTGAPADLNLSNGAKYKTNRRNYKAYKRYLRKQDKITDKLEQSFSKLEGKSERELFNYGKDSLNCINYFYKALLTTSAEKEVLDMAEFNLNKDVIRKKLENLPEPFTCGDVKKLIRRRDSLEKAILLAKNKASIGKQADFANFGISSTGIYNADQVKNIAEPMLVEASYKNEDGVPLKIISTFLNIERLNGIIRYDGYMGYGPYKFVYGKMDKTMLIAVDDKQHSYYCTAEEFTMYTSKAEQGKVIFKLKPLENLQTTEKLEEVMLK